MNIWRTRGAVVEVSSNGGPWTTPTLPSTADTTARAGRVLGYSKLVQTFARHENVPAAWLFGTMYVESGGDADAKGADGERGLMQIMPTTAASMGRDPARLFEPAYNIETAAILLGQFRRTPLDRVEAASCYNAGAGANGRPHPSEKSPWGLREYPGYIASVVAATNYFATMARNAPPGVLVPLLLGVGIYAVFSVKRSRSRRAARGSEV